MFRTILAIAMAIVVAAGVACGDEKEDSQQQTDLEGHVEALHLKVDGLTSRVDYHDERIQRGEMLGAMTALHVEALQDLADELQSASEVPAGTIDRVKRMLGSMQAAQWPNELQERAHGLEETLDSLMDALTAGALATAEGLATEAHAVWHDLEQDAFITIAGPQPEHDHNPDGSHVTPVPTAAN